MGTLADVRKTFNAFFGQGGLRDSLMEQFKVVLLLVRQLIEALEIGNCLKQAVCSGYLGAAKPVPLPLRLQEMFWRIAAANNNPMAAWPS